MTHGMAPKEYFDKYVEPFEHKCVYCGRENVKFINMRVGYATSCGSHDCALKATRKTRLEKYGDENYSNREQFKKTVKSKKDADPEWIERISAKQRSTMKKHIEEDPDFWNKRKLKSR